MCKVRRVARGRRGERRRRGAGAGRRLRERAGGCGAGRAGRARRSGAPAAAAAAASRRAAGGATARRPTAGALPPGPTGTSCRRGGAARFAEGVKCLKYGGGSESPRTTPPPSPARGRRSGPRFPEGSCPVPEPPRCCLGSLLGVGGS